MSYDISNEPAQRRANGVEGRLPAGDHMATVNGDVISSNTPEGVLRRFETGLNRHTDIGGPGKEDVTVELVVRGRVIACRSWPFGFSFAVRHHSSSGK